MTDKYIMLDEKDFACLVRGGILRCGNVQIALQDIGFIQMEIAIENARVGIDRYKGHTREEK